MYVPKILPIVLMTNAITYPDTKLSYLNTIGQNGTFPGSTSVSYYRRDVLSNKNQLSVEITWVAMQISIDVRKGK